MLRLGEDAKTASRKDTKTNAFSLYILLIRARIQLKRRNVDTEREFLNKNKYKTPFWGNTPHN
jgi:hypothetical protein